jgi:hypothetical protein
MPPARPKKTAAKKARSIEDAPLALIWGDDDYAVKQRARQVFTTWTEKTGEFDQEIIEATAENVDHVTLITISAPEFTVFIKECLTWQFQFLL